MSTALVVGATGLIGAQVLKLLLEGSAFEKVRAVVRRASGAPHVKLDERVVDFEALKAADFAGVDAVFSCLGTTIKVAGSQERFARVDHDYVVATAKLAREGGATALALVSAVGAGAGATSFYARVKGQAEADVEALGYPTLEIFQPGLLLGDRAERRPVERFFQGVFPVLQGALVGGLRRYRAVEAGRVARAMVAALAAATPGVHRRTFDDIVRLAP